MDAHDGWWRRPELGRGGGGGGALGVHDCEEQVHAEQKQDERGLEAHSGWMIWRRGAAVTVGEWGMGWDEVRQGAGGGWFCRATNRRAGA